MKGVRWETVISAQEHFDAIATIRSQGLSWYAFDRYGETKGIKLKKMIRHVFLG
jgi:hypothetical protein